MRGRTCFGLVWEYNNVRVKHFNNLLFNVGLSFLGYSKELVDFYQQMVLAQAVDSGQLSIDTNQNCRFAYALCLLNDDNIVKGTSIVWRDNTNTPRVLIHDGINRPSGDGAVTPYIKGILYRYPEYPYFSVKMGTRQTSRALYLDFYVEKIAGLNYKLGSVNLGNISNAVELTNIINKYTADGKSRILG